MEEWKMVCASSAYWEQVKEALPAAGANTLLGIATVFVALIFISFIISLFRYISVAERKLADKKAANTPTPVQETVPAALPEESGMAEEEDDLELVAVITAAVYAYEEAQGNTAAPGDLVVRSIRKKRQAGWQNA